MPNSNQAQIVEFEDLTFEQGDIEGVQTALLEFEPCETKVVFYKAGTNVPRHNHSGQTLTVVLKGRCEGPDGKDLTAGILYKCGGVQYGPWLVYEDTYFLIIQKLGTKFIK